MLKIYCTECGGPTSYSVNKPKFCSHCGNPFEKLVVNKTQFQKQTISKIRPRQIEELNIEDDDEGSEVNYVPEISQIDCEIIGESNKKEKIGNIMGTSDPSMRTRQPRQKAKKITKAEKKKFLEDFQREAGSLRPKNRGNKNG
jgi:ribosomal protein L37E